MKFSSILLFASTVASTLAAPAALKSRVFKLRTAGSPNSELNNFWLENSDNRASFKTGGKIVEAYFADDGSRRLIVNGLDGTEDNAFLTPEASTSAVSDFVFGDGSPSTDWGITGLKLVYGSEDRFYAFPAGAGWEVRWVGKDAIITENAFPVDLAVEYLV